MKLQTSLLLCLQFCPLQSGFALFSAPKILLKAKAATPTGASTKRRTADAGLAINRGAFAHRATWLRSHAKQPNRQSNENGLFSDAPLKV